MKVRRQNATGTRQQCDGCKAGKTCELVWKFHRFVRSFQLRGSPLSSSAASAGVRRSTAFTSTLTVSVNIPSPVIAAAKKKQIRLRHHDSAAVTTVHNPHTSGQSRQKCDAQ